MARCSIWPPARKAMATPSRSGSGAANGPSTRKRKDRTTRKETPMTDTSRLSWQLLMVGPGIDRITPDIQDKLASLLDLLPATATINVQTDAGYVRSEEHTSELQSLMRISYAVFCLKTKKTRYIYTTERNQKQQTSTPDTHQKYIRHR